MGYQLLFNERALPRSTQPAQAERTELHPLHRQSRLSIALVPWPSRSPGVAIDSQSMSQRVTSRKSERIRESASSVLSRPGRQLVGYGYRASAAAV